MTSSLPSLTDSPPLESGGVDNRRGIEFQDHVAAKHCLDMLHDEEILEVWHEYHDDVLVLREAGESKTAEYIQVKNTDEQLWSIAAITRRDKKTNPSSGKRESVVGSSILEKNLDNDRRAPVSLFRIVTSKEVNRDLGLLKLPRESLARAANVPAMQKIHVEIESKVGDFRSIKGNSCSFWLNNVIWDVFHSIESLSNSNKDIIRRFAELSGFNLKTFELDAVYRSVCEAVSIAGRVRVIENPEIKKFKSAEFKSKVLELIKLSVVPDGIYDNISEFDLSLDYLRDIIFQLHRFNDSETISSMVNDFKLIDMSEKNKLNGMTDSFFSDLFSRFGKHFEKIRKFLSLPINIESNEKYQDLVVEIGMLIVRYRGSVANFDTLIFNLCGKLTNGSLVDVERKKRYVWMLISYMYYNCDIGRRE